MQTIKTCLLPFAIRHLSSSSFQVSSTFSPRNRSQQARSHIPYRISPLFSRAAKLSIDQSVTARSSAHKFYVHTLLRYYEFRKARRRVCVPVPYGGMKEFFLRPPPFHPKSKHNAFACPSAPSSQKLN